MLFDLKKKIEKVILYYSDFTHISLFMWHYVSLQRLTTETKVEDIKGKLLPAVDVFAHAIRYLKKCLTEEIERRDTSVYVQEENITWVLTVPAIWDDPAKQFMRKAAEKVCILSLNIKHITQT